MAKILFVEDFPTSVTDHQLYNVFAAVGQVLSATIMRSHTGESLRFGFVEMASEEEAIKAMQTLHRTLFEASHRQFRAPQTVLKGRCNADIRRHFQSRRGHLNIFCLDWLTELAGE